MAEDVKYTFTKEGMKKVAIGAGITAGGALLTYLTEVIGNIDLGPWTPIVVSGWSILVNIARKYIQNQ
jgi:hypothetical protein